MTTAVERFLKYVSYDTQSDEAYDTCPSTEKQLLLANELKRELEEMGASDVRMSEYGYLFACIPDNTDSTSAPQEAEASFSTASAHGASDVGQKATIPALGFISHIDTAPSLTGTNVKPRIVQAYDGKDIVLNAEKQIVMKVSEFPFLADLKGQDLIVTDGTTLLGADDKAGVAEIMTMAEYFLSHPEIPHGEICIGFTPDEEIGRGADRFDVKDFGAAVAYTVDGGPIGEIEYENFNAASGKVRIQGASIHPGDAKLKMKNAILIGMEFQSLLPVFENPMYTEDYEGFYHLIGMEGEVEQATVSYIIRDHDRQKFEARKIFMQKCAEKVNEKYGEGTVRVDIKDQYYNMRQQVEPLMHIIDIAFAAMQEAGVEPKVKAIRGGTDGAQLSFKGLPCPNIFAGGLNFHGRYEFVPIQSIEKAMNVIVKIAELTAKRY